MRQLNRIKNKLTNNKLIFETKYFPIEKKTGPGQIQTHDLCRLRRIRYLQTKRAGDVKKIDFVMTHVILLNKLLNQKNSI